MKKKKEKEQAKEAIFQFIIGDPNYPGNEKEYKSALKIYKCCVINKGNEHCIECSKFPCAKYDSLKKTTAENGYKLIKYQKNLKKDK